MRHEDSGQHALRWGGWLRTTYIFVHAVSGYAPRFQDIGDEGFFPDHHTRHDRDLFCVLLPGTSMMER